MNPDPAVTPTEEPAADAGSPLPLPSDPVPPEPSRTLDDAPPSATDNDIDQSEHFVPLIVAPAQAAGPATLPATPGKPPSKAVPATKGHIPPSPHKAHVHKPPPATAKVDLQLQFPNGSVGKPYDAQKPVVLRVPVSKTSEGLMAVCTRIEGLAEIGLHGDFSVGNTIRIFGTPSKPGDHPITVVYTIRSKDLELGSQSKTITLTVNPDPRSLWKDLEPEPDQPFVKPHVRSERLAGSMVLLGASRRGRSHAHEAKFREDDFRLGGVEDSGWFYMAVADGAGSARFSRRGSELACETACQELETQIRAALDDAFDEHVKSYVLDGASGASPQISNALYKVLGGAGHSAYRRIDVESKDQSCPLKDFATTLNLTICRNYGTGWFVASFAVGDGGVAIFRDNAQTRILSTPDSGEFAGQTRFLTMSEIWSSGKEINDRIQFAVVPDLTAVIAMTDGVSDPKFATDKNFFDPAKWTQLWTDLGTAVTLTRENEKADTQLLDWLDFWSTGNHDDRTIALMLP